MKRNRRPWPTQDRKEELAEEGARPTKWSRERWASRNIKEELAEEDALWERYAPIRAEAKAASLRAFLLSGDPTATPEEKEAAWNEAKEAGERRIEAHPDRVRRQKETSHHEN